MNNERTIKLKIHEESDLFSELDPDQELISDDVQAYLTRKFNYAHKTDLESYSIRSISDTPVNEENVREKERSRSSTVRSTGLR